MTPKQAIETAYYDAQTAKHFLMDAQRMLVKFDLTELSGESLTKAQKSLTNAQHEVLEAEAFLRELKEQDQ